MYYPQENGDLLAQRRQSSNIITAPVKNIKKVASAYHFALLLDDEGKLYSIGDHMHLDIEHVLMVDKMVVVVPFKPGHRFTNIFARGFFAIATDTERMYLFGERHLVNRIAELFGMPAWLVRVPIRRKM
jgi:hypothetical protein